MYLVAIKIKREGDKPVNEQYLVDAVSITDVAIKIAGEFDGVDVEITSCKVVYFTEVFEGVGGIYFEVKVRIETIDDKKVTEVYIQEAATEPDARALFGMSVTTGNIISFVEKPYKEIIR